MKLKAGRDLADVSDLKDVVNNDGTVHSDMVGMAVSASAGSAAMALSAVADGLRSGRVRKLSLA